MPLPDHAPARLAIPPSAAGSRRRLLAALLLALPAGAWSAPPAVTIEREDPRLYGYQLGDVIDESVTLHLQPGYALDPQSLPRGGKRAGWFLVRGSSLRQATQADGSTRIDLHLEMQLTNSPTAARTLTVPAVALRFKGPQPLEETIPSLTIDAVPLATGEVRTGLPDVRETRPAPLIDTSRTRARLHWVGIAALLLAAWLAASLSWKRLAARRVRPFAQLQRDLRRLLPATVNGDGARNAVQRVHRAFDEAAGHRLFAAAVPAFCRARGADADLEARTVAFFATSQSLFFAVGDAPVPDTLGRELGELCRAWRRFEGRHP